MTVEARARPAVVREAVTAVEADHLAGDEAAIMIPEAGRRPEEALHSGQQSGAGAVVAATDSWAIILFQSRWIWFLLMNTLKRLAIFRVCGGPKRAVASASTREMPATTTAKIEASWITKEVSTASGMAVILTAAEEEDLIAGEDEDLTEAEVGAGGILKLAEVEALTQVEAEDSMVAG